MSTNERKQFSVRWNKIENIYDEPLCIQELFEARVRENPDAVAVICAGKKLSYGELNKQANQLAHYLQGLGVAQESLIGLCIERSFEMVVVVLAILKVGSAYSHSQIDEVQ